MPQKVNTTDLKIGMFVADLDRPWIDTPFLLQGFLIEDQDQLVQLRTHCAWVLIDPHRSVGEEFASPLRKSPSPPPRDPDPEPQVVVHRVQMPNGAHASSSPTAPVVRAPAPVAPPRRPADGRGSGAKPRDFAVVTKQGRDASTAPRQTNVREDASAPGMAPRSGLWNQLRESMAGLFGRKAHEELDDTAAAEPAPAPTAAAPHPGFIPETVQLTIYDDKKTVEDELGAATAAFQRSSDLLHRVVEDIRAGNSLQLDAIDEVIEDMVDSMVRNPDALMWVARIREKNLTVYDHGLSVAVSLIAFGRHLGYPKDELSQLGMVGLLLDVGKIKLPRELLEKNARLSSEEFELIKDHVDLGLDILKQTPNIHPDVLEGIAQHHERMNGTGYPNCLMGEAIGVFGRMAAIADTYAAVTRRRPYAEAVSPHEALQMLSNWSGTQFHADMVEQFIQSIGVFPVGSLVELSTGEVAVVVTHNKLKRLRPKVLVITETDKSPNAHPALRDLLYDVSEKPAYIRRGLPSNAFGLDASEYYLN